MKKLLLITVLSSVFLSVSNAQGIPVYDNASVIQAVAQVKEATKQLAELKEQVSLAKSQLDEFKNEAENMKKRLEGFSNFGSNFDTKELQSYLDEIINIDTTKVNDFMKKYLDEGAEKELKTTIEHYAKSATNYESMIEQLASKNQEIEKLKAQLSSADTPQKREEISNVIAIEQLQQNNLNNAMNYELKKQSIETEAQKKKEYTDYTNELFGGYE